MAIYISFPIIFPLFQLQLRCIFYPYLFHLSLLFSHSSTIFLLFVKSKKFYYPISSSYNIFYFSGISILVNLLAWILFIFLYDYAYYILFTFSVLYFMLCQITGSTILFHSHSFIPFCFLIFLLHFIILFIVISFCLLWSFFILLT